jgi:hypothetical protein
MEIKTVTLKFGRERLLYDIENCAFVEGDVMETDSEHRRHPVMDIAQDGNIDRVLRTLDLAFAECVEMLYPYSKETVEDVVLDDALDEPEEYEVALALPASFSMSTVRLLRSLIHEYLVCRVLWDWLSMTDKPAAANWGERLYPIEEAIRTNLHGRCGRLRRTQTPF